MNEQQRQTEGQLEGRIESLENTFHEFLAADRDWQADFSEGDRQFKSEVRQSLQAINEKASNAGRTNFATLGTWAAIIVGIICSLVGGFIYMEDKSSEQRQTFQAQLQAQNQTWMLREIDRNESGLSNLDNKLQREMNLITATTESKIENDKASILALHNDLQDRVKRMEGIHDSAAVVKPRRMTASEFLDSP